MAKKEPGHIIPSTKLRHNCVNCAIMSKNNSYIQCKTGFEPEIVLSSVRTVIEEFSQSYTKYSAEKRKESNTAKLCIPITPKIRKSFKSFTRYHEVKTRSCTKLGEVFLCGTLRIPIIIGTLRNFVLQKTPYLTYGY